MYCPQCAHRNEGHKFTRGLVVFICHNCRFMWAGRELGTFKGILKDTSEPHIETTVSKAV